ncbi:MAG: NUDIX hydrolase [Lentisphaeria bacterium]|nr:NUDIX hydrolase [Lentisphaeria bacterium]
MTKVNISDIIKKSVDCYDGFFKMKCHTIQYQQFDGSMSKIHQREVFVRDPTVAVLLYDENQNSVLLTEQFRVGPLENQANPWVFELPAGIVEQGEDKIVAMQREILEETGYDCKIESLIGEFYLSPGGSNEVTTIYFAQVALDKSGVHGVESENEDIKTHIVTLDKAGEMIQQGKLSVTTGLALMWLQARALSSNK